MPHEEGNRLTSRLLRPTPTRRTQSSPGIDIFARPTGRELKQQDVLEFFGSGVTGTQLARNPELNLFIAQVLQRDIDTFLSGGSVHKGTPQFSGVPRIDQRNASFFKGTSFASDFFNEQNRIRQNFVGSEITRLFGEQGVTSRSSTVGPSGVRTIIGGGPVASTRPTSAQRGEIEARFQTPLQQILAHQPVSSVGTGGAGIGIQRRGDPTDVSGAGIRRRRLSGAQAPPTILTSDSDGAVRGRTRRGPGILGGATILG